MQQLLTATRILSTSRDAKVSQKEKWLSDNVGTRNIGRLLLRITPQGTQRFYYRPYRKSGNAPKVIPIGLYCRIAKEGFLTLNQARLKVHELQRDIHSNVPANLPLPPDSSANASTPPAVTGSLQATLPQTPTGTLLQMCLMYAQSLEDDGKQSAGDTRRYVERYIAPSNLAHVRACELKAPQFTELLRNVIGETSGYTASKVRSLLHAAYARAASSHLDPSASGHLVNFNIEVNPITGIDALRQYHKARDRYLRDSELKEFWKRIELNQDSTIGLRGLRICMLLGGQRGEQMLSVKTSHVDLDAKTILLFDSKGRRSIPRQHLLPLCPQAETEIRWLFNYARMVSSTSLFPGSRKGSTCRQETISEIVRRIRCDMETEGHISEPFAFLDLRRTIVNRPGFRGGRLV